MSKVRVRCLIENADDQAHIDTKGIRKGNTLSFYDDQHVKHAITFGEDTLRYERDGHINMDFLFEKAVVHSGNYRVKEGGFVFNVHTHELIITQGEIKVEYSLKQGDTVVNEGRLNVTYEEI